MNIINKHLITINGNGKMKALITILFTAFSAYCAQAQTQTNDLIYKIQELTLEKDSLEKTVQALNDSIDKFIKENRDTTTRLKIINTALKHSYDSIMKINQSNIQKIANLNKSKVKIERDSIQKIIAFKDSSLKYKEIDCSKKDSIINVRDGIISAEREKQKAALIQEFDDGKKVLINEIINSYNLPLDELIKKPKIFFVKEDNTIINKNDGKSTKIINLQQYYASESVLTEKYDEQKIQDALRNIAQIEQNRLVEDLIKKLKNYGLNNQALKSTIDSIAVIDKMIVANDDYTQKEKFKDIMVEVSWFIKHYRFNFIDYPYLNERIVRLIREKQVDANKDISAIKQEL